MRLREDVAASIGGKRAADIYLSRFALNKQKKILDTTQGK